MRPVLAGMALCAALPAQWEPISPGPFQIGPHAVGLEMGPNWWGLSGTGGVILLHAGPEAITFTHTNSPWRIALHVSHVAAIGPPCARGGLFHVADAWCGHYPRFVSDRDPMDGSPIDFWIGSVWGETMGMCVDAAWRNCSAQAKQRVFFLLFVDDLRLVPI